MQSVKACTQHNSERVEPISAVFCTPKKKSLLLIPESTDMIFRQKMFAESECSNEERILILIAEK